MLLATAVLLTFVLVDCFLNGKANKKHSGLNAEQFQSVIFFLKIVK